MMGNAVQASGWQSQGLDRSAESLSQTMSLEDTVVGYEETGGWQANELKRELVLHQDYALEKERKARLLVHDLGRVLASQRGCEATMREGFEREVGSE